MRGAAMINSSALKSLERSIFIIGTTTLAVSAFMVISAGYNYFRHADAENKLLVTNEHIHSLKATISQSKRLKYPAPSERELSIVQKCLDRYSNIYDCQLTEVTSNNDEGIYLSRYKKGTAETGWKQFLVQCQIIGSITNTMSLLRELSSKAIPIEFQTIEISPLESHRFGHPQVLAKVTFQVMKQEVVR